MSRLPRVVAIIVGLLMVVLGIWAFAAPRSFFNQIANFPPYNRHLFHDLGAFQFGIGAVLLLAVTWADALAAALGGAAAGATLHLVSHIMDRDLGGKDSDPILLALLAAALIIATAVRRRAGRT